LFPDPDPNGNKNGIIEVSYANFGLIPYGHSMHGRITHDNKYENACTEFPHDYYYQGTQELREKEEFKDSDSNWLKSYAQDMADPAHLGYSPFYIADRGDCTFVEKVRNIEESGAALAIIVDNK